MIIHLNPFPEETLCLLGMVISRQGMGIAKKIVSRYITIRDQRIVIHITIHITRINKCENGSSVFSTKMHKHIVNNSGHKLGGT